MTKRDFIENFIFYGIIVGIVFVCCKYLLPIMIPFVIGYIAAYTAHELSKNTTEDMSKTQKVITLVAIYIVLIVLSFFVVAYLVSKFRGLVTWMSSYVGYIEPLINNVTAAITEFSKKLPAEAKEFMGTILGAVSEGLKNVLIALASALSGFVTNLVKSFPSLFLNIVVAIISSFYILLDYERVNTSLKKWVPKKLKGLAEKLVLFVKEKLFKIIKSYAVIMGLTFVELAIGLIVSRTPSALLLALLIAILDILPVLGVGTALIPWAIVELILGRVVYGVWLLIVYVAITVIRNIVEPKLVGEDLGLDPLTTLVSMIVGMELAGIVGLFGLPLSLSFVRFVLDLEPKEKKKEKKIA